jgi:hypothetical protein
MRRRVFQEIMEQAISELREALGEELKEAETGVGPRCLGSRGALVSPGLTS